MRASSYLKASQRHHKSHHQPSEERTRIGREVYKSIGRVNAFVGDHAYTPVANMSRQFTIEQVTAHNLDEKNPQDNWYVVIHGEVYRVGSIPFNKCKIRESFYFKVPLVSRSALINSRRVTQRRTQELKFESPRPDKCCNGRGKIAPWPGCV